MGRQLSILLYIKAGRVKLRSDVALLASFQKVHWETSTGCFSTHPFRECMTDAIQHDDNGFRRFGNGPDEIPVLPS